MNLLEIISIVIGSSVVSTLIHVFYSEYQERKRKTEEPYKILYGPLRLHLQMMRHIVSNQDSVLKEIQKWGSVDTRNDLMLKHLSPLSQKWLRHRDEIRKLFEQNSGLVKKEDFNLMSDYLDGCLKREVIEDGQNVLAVNEEMTNKLLDAIEALQKKLLSRD